MDGLERNFTRPRQMRSPHASSACRVRLCAAFSGRPLLSHASSSCCSWPKIGLRHEILNRSAASKPLAAIDHLPPEQKVGGSNPLGRTNFLDHLCDCRRSFRLRKSTLNADASIDLAEL